jgi:hypothetical protein
MKVETGAFSQLTRKYMSETFNPNTPDVDDVRCVPVASSPYLILILVEQILFLRCSSAAKHMVCLPAIAQNPDPDGGP